MKRIAIDVDGVLRQLMQSLCNQVARTEQDYVSPENIKTWNLSPYFKMGKGIYDYMFRDNVTTIYSMAKTYTTNVSYLRKWYSQGHYIHIITSQPTQTTQALTLNWLYSNGIPFNTLTFSDDKWMHSYDFLIEDKLKTAQKCLEHGKNCYLIKRPWNENDTIYRHEDFSTIDEQMFGG